MRDAWLRAGRLLELPSGLVDLATGCGVSLDSSLVPAAAAPSWQAPPIGTVSADGRGRCIDGWLTKDWLGRWVARCVIVDTSAGPDRWCNARPRPADIVQRAVPHCWLEEWTAAAIGITRADDATAWCRLAAQSRSHGLVAVHLSMLSTVMQRCDPAGWPPLVVGVPASRCRSEDETMLSAWADGGGRTAGLVRLQGCPDASSQPHAPADRRVDGCLQHETWRKHAAQARLVHRAWRALDRAPTWPGWTRIGSPAGGRAGMTHLELLDVSAQLDDARRDEEACAVACRALLLHAEADHTVLLLAHGGELRVLASEGPPAESMLAWQQLARPDAPPAIVSSRGWHAIGRHELETDASLIVGACWRSRETGLSRQHLLEVFARLVAGRAPAIVEQAPMAAPGLEQTLVGISTAMQDARAQIALAARAPFPVLIRGESGCGKELAARAIHTLGPRRHRRCAALNCAALPDELIESELFGHVRGAFTGAAADRLGLFDEADGGTLFLDEVGELGGRAQAKLLRVLQDGEIRRVGENQARRVDVRVVAATNVSLEDAVRRGTFRADLFYRLDVVRVRMPSLRERRDDIPLLARHFWHECTGRVGSRARLEGRVIDVLARADWPGNVRQLQNTLASLAVRVPPRGRVAVSDLPPEIRTPDESSVSYLTRSGLDAARREFEASYVRDALARAGGRPALAARDLGLTRQGLTKLVRRLGLDEAPAGSRLP